MSIAEKISRAKDDYDAVYGAGKQAEYDRFWDAYQDNGNREGYSIYSGGFAGPAWTDENFNPKYPISPTDASYMFRSTGITDLTKDGVVLDFSKCKNFNYAFGYNGGSIKLPTIDMSSATSCTSTFADSGNTSLSLIFSENTPAGNMFSNVKKLVNLTMGGTIGKEFNVQWSLLLSNESVQSIIDALKDLTGQTTQKVQFHANVGAKLTDAQKATITARNWTLVY